MVSRSIAAGLGSGCGCKLELLEFVDFILAKDGISMMSPRSLLEIGWEGTNVTALYLHYCDNYCTFP